MIGEPKTAPPVTGLDSVVGEVADDFLRRWERGERPDPEEYVVRHPEAADLIRKVLKSLRLVEYSGSNDSPTGEPGHLDPEPLGDFRLLRQVGRGGMGIVYEASQLSLGRRVALKVLPFAATMDPRQLTRFHNEAKAAGSLRHEHIVHVYGVGCERGVHYFAMEFIDGQTLAQVIDWRSGSRERSEDRPDSVTGPYPEPLARPGPPDTAAVAALSTERTGAKGRDFFRRAAELIADAADALEHAHSLGIVHRDVKPGNLLIDHAGKVYVSDFGLARLGPDAGLTMSGDLLGTLRYMAPEQALARHGLADHRVDVYGLGCTLYELLTGRPVVGGTEKADILRRLAFEEPIALRKLDKAVPAELETIALKCLAKNPAERYATAGELAADLRRWLEDKPIKAKPPTMLQRGVRRLRRHPRVLAAAFAVAVLAAVGATASAVLLDREKRRAVTAEQTATAVKDFFVHDLLRLAAADRQAEERGSGVEVDPDLKVRDVLVRAAHEIEGKFADQPLVEAELRNTLGWTLNHIEMPNQAVPQLQRARAIRSALLGPDDPGTFECISNLVGSYSHLGRRTEALNLCEEALALAKAKLGPDHRQTLNFMNSLAAIYNDHFGRHADAALLFEETLRLQKAKLGPDHADTLRGMNNLAISYDALGRYAEALKLREETLALMKAKLGAEHPLTLGSMTCLALSYDALDRPGESLKLREETLALMKAKLGPDRAETLRSMGELAESYDHLGRHADALKLREETLALMKAKLGPNHPATLAGMNNLANTFVCLGRHADALKLREETLALMKAKLGPDGDDTLRCRGGLASDYANLGHHSEALKLREETLALMKARLGPDHPDTIKCMHVLANSYTHFGRHVEALKLNEETLALRKAKLGPDHPGTLLSMDNLANSYTALGRHDEALKLREETLALRKVKLGPDHPDTLACMMGLANSYESLGRHAEALKLREETLAIMKARLGPDHPGTLLGMNNLANSYFALGRHAEALKLREETLALRKVKLGPDHPDTLASMINLAHSYAILGRHSEALKLYEVTLALCKVKLRPDHPYTGMVTYGIARIHAFMISTSRDPPRHSPRQANLAMDWLKRAVAAGYRDVDLMKKDTDLDALRDRDDFKKLLAELEAARKPAAAP